MYRGKKHPYKHCQTGSVARNICAVARFPFSANNSLAFRENKKIYKSNKKNGKNQLLLSTKKKNKHSTLHK